RRPRMQNRMYAESPYEWHAVGDNQLYNPNGPDLYGQDPRDTFLHHSSLRLPGIEIANTVWIYHVYARILLLLHLFHFIICVIIFNIVSISNSEVSICSFSVSEGPVYLQMWQRRTIIMIK